MMTFSCAVQTVQAGDLALHFDVEVEDTAICRLTVGDYVLRFQRNGMLLSVTEVEPEKESENAPAANDGDGAHEPA